MAVRGAAVAKPKAVRSGFLFSLALLLAAGTGGAWYLLHLEEQPRAEPVASPAVEAAEVTTAGDLEEVSDVPPAQAEAEPEPPPEPSPRPAPRKKPSRPILVEPEDAVATRPPTRAMRRGDLILRGWPNVEEPEPMTEPRCAYPAPARGRGLKVWLRVVALVDENGNVVEARVPHEDPSGLGFNQAALDAVRGTRFFAATRDGIPGTMWTDLVCDFVDPSPPP
jgi:TonB family protein